MTRTTGTQAVQICNGLGAGNLGDDLMAWAFWQTLPPEVTLEVEVLPNEAALREPYPAHHRYRRVGWDGDPPIEPGPLPGLLVGDTPVSATLGLAWPLGFLAPRLDAFHRTERPVDALGVGVEPLILDEARALFRRHFLPIRSWTVRTEACRDALLDLGVPEHRLAVGADWAWLYRPREDRRPWAATTWRELGVDPGRPILVVNAVNEIWRDVASAKRVLATALDEVARRFGLQVAFFCQEMREGEFYDLAAARETATLMRVPTAVVPNRYYTPDELLGLLAHATVTLGGRYHFVVASVLAGALPVCLARSAKMDGLLAELGLSSAGRLDEASVAGVVEAVGTAVRGGSAERRRLEGVRLQLEARARGNLALWARHREREAAPRANA